MGSTPRVVVVTRPTDFEELMARHGTREQARFFLEQRDQKIDEVEARHRALEQVLTRVSQQIPLRWRRARVPRAELSRFVWEPEDLVVAVGQDGLVPNVAKYLDGQRVIGVNPEPARVAGVLVRHEVDALELVLRRTVEQRAVIEARTMVEARLDDGQRLLALNEIYVGHRTHQSARYRIVRERATERHSSSGLIVATGTGSTGWARSIARERATKLALPAPTEACLAFFVREAWPSPATGTSITEGLVEGSARLEITSEMNEGGVLFGDGIEDDRVAFGWGLRARLGVARERLQLVVGAR
ncbi:NAD(+)/NADH kinase [Sandaracinus amylolyticus]|uniref:NAD(+)/NADH kinase n=1 Tax=Sandaracinus amylolyticus TaxID=927083 RepID=UPI00069F44F5|nr:NAD(+)/NADH kinase [Sandaracinus amylolyticus]